LQGRKKADIFLGMDRLMQTQKLKKRLSFLSPLLSVAALALAGLLLRGRAH
jgi:hypothetical protein